MRLSSGTGVDDAVVGVPDEVVVGLGAQAPVDGVAVSAVTWAALPVAEALKDGRGELGFYFRCCDVQGDVREGLG